MSWNGAGLRGGGGKSHVPHRAPLLVLPFSSEFREKNNLASWFLLLSCTPPTPKSNSSSLKTSSFIPLHPLPISLPSAPRPASSTYLSLFQKPATKVDGALSRKTSPTQSSPVSYPPLRILRRPSCFAESALSPPKKGTLREGESLFFRATRARLSETPFPSF